MNVPADIAEFFERLDRTGIPYLVGGSYASSAHGQPRQTNDIDISLKIEPGLIDRFVEEFGSDYMVSRPTIVQALESDEWFRSFQIINFKSLLRIDCFVPIDEPFSRSEFSRRGRISLYKGLDAWVSSPEDIVLRKLQWFALGGQVSDKQWNDILGVLETKKGELDEGYLNEWSRYLNVEDLLENARSQVVV